ncbi:hypothetical protein V6N13_036661 [Hibiscus sabdariffa]|uniref:Uncharacterized protein n=1 Tax=Hibiscus sabdariffa TaxID=183260 RepID=A0ABR2S5Q6_9ROSI
MIYPWSIVVNNWLFKTTVSKDDHSFFATNFDDAKLFLMVKDLCVDGAFWEFNLTRMIKWLKKGPINEVTVERMAMSKDAPTPKVVTKSKAGKGEAKVKIVDDDLPQDYEIWLKMKVPGTKLDYPNSKIMC